MGLVVLFKAGLVGALGLIIAIVAVLALLTFSSEALRVINANARKFPAIITLVVVWAIGWGISYWYFSIVGNNFSDEVLLTTFACLFTLTPSFSMVCAAFAYYIEVQKVVNVVNKD